MEGSVKRAQRQRMGAACASRCAFSHLAPVCPFAGHVRKPHPPVACPLRLPATHIQRWQNKGLGLFTLFLKDAVAIKKSLAKAHAANKVCPLARRATKAMGIFDHTPKGTYSESRHSLLCALCKHLFWVLSHA